MSIKEIMVNRLEEVVSQTRKNLGVYESYLETAREINFDNATYRVQIETLREDEGQGSIDIQHTGTVTDAVLKAEKEYRTRNDTSVIRTIPYKVNVLVKGKEIPVPEEAYDHVVSRAASVV